LLFGIAKNLVCPEKTLRKYFKDISDYGFRKNELRSSWPNTIVGLCFIFSYPYIQFRIIWFILGALALFIPIFFIIKRSVDQDVESMLKNVNEEAIQRGIKKRRIQSFYKIAMLVAWLFSWNQIIT
jgi:hypothetical protein